MRGGRGGEGRPPIQDHTSDFPLTATSHPPLGVRDYPQGPPQEGVWLFERRGSPLGSLGWVQRKQSPIVEAKWLVSV